MKKDILPKHLHRNIRNAFRLRQISDYGIPGSISKEKSQELIAYSKEFIEAIEGYLKKEKYKI